MARTEDNVVIRFYHQRSFLFIRRFLQESAKLRNMDKSNRARKVFLSILLPGNRYLSLWVQRAQEKCVNSVSQQHVFRNVSETMKNSRQFDATEK